MEPAGSNPGEVWCNVGGGSFVSWWPASGRSSDTAQEKSFLQIFYYFYFRSSEDDKTFLHSRVKYVIIVTTITTVNIVNLVKLLTLFGFLSLVP